MVEILPGLSTTFGSRSELGWVIRIVVAHIGLIIYKDMYLFGMMTPTNALFLKANQIM